MLKTVYHICVYIKSHFRNVFILATNCSDFMIHLNCEKIECSLLNLNGLFLPESNIDFVDFYVVTKCAFQKVIHK